MNSIALGYDQSNCNYPLPNWILKSAIKSPIFHILVFIKCPSLNYIKVIRETSFSHILKMVATIIWLKSCQYGIKTQIINQSIYIFHQKIALVSTVLIIINCVPLTDQKIGWRSKEMPKPWVLLVDVLKSDFLSPALLDQLEKQPP